jgi:hypothetical protein
LQAIRIGDYTQKYHRLIEFTEENKHTLHYAFEHDIRMTLEKVGNTILMDLYDPTRQLSISKQVDPVLVKYFKPIRLSTASQELDKIYELFQ